MKYITFSFGSETLCGVLADGKAYPLQEFGYSAKTLEEFIINFKGSEHSDIANALKERLIPGIPLSESQLFAPLPEPRQEILVMQNNYAGTSEEAEALRARIGEKDFLPTYYYKKATLASTDGGVIPRYEGFLEQLDLQAELCAVTAGDAYRVPKSEAHAKIFGYVVINNVIAHDVTARHRRPYISTSLDGFLPMSPYIVSADEFEPNHEFRIRSFVNGQICQNATTAQRIFSPEYVIADISRTSVLCGASIIATGTPAGSLRDLGAGYLKAGDTVTVEVEGVGCVTSTVRA